MTRRPSAEEPPLFDLPLEPVADRPRPEAETEQQRLPLAPDARGAAAADAPAAGLRPVPGTAGLRPRLAAGLIDLGFCAAVLLVLMVVLWSMDTVPAAADLPAAGLFLLAFSFLYQVLPLAFWGRTPGMSLAGLRASAAGGGPLTFRQTSLRWLGSVLTVALAGLPLLLVPTGRSLSDRLSGSVTRAVPAGR